MRSKWKSLRDTYRREIRKVIEEGDQYQTTWAYFGSLDFLKDQFATTPSNGDTLDSSEFDANVDVTQSSGQPEDPDVKYKVSTDIQNDFCPDQEFIRSRKRKRRSEGHIGTAQDEDACFLNSLLPHMRSLPVREKLLLRLQMQELVYSFVCSAGQQSQPPKAKSPLPEGDLLERLHNQQSSKSPSESSCSESESCAD